MKFDSSFSRVTNPKSIPTAVAWGPGGITASLRSQISCHTVCDIAHPVLCYAMLCYTALSYTMLILIIHVYKIVLIVWSSQKNVEPLQVLASEQCKRNNIPISFFIPNATFVVLECFSSHCWYFPAVPCTAVNNLHTDVLKWTAVTQSAQTNQVPLE